MVAYSGPGAPRFPKFNWLRDIVKTANLNIFSKYIQKEEDDAMYLADANSTFKRWIQQDWKRYTDKMVEENKTLPSPNEMPSRVGDDQPITIFAFVAAIVHMELVTDAAACDQVFSFNQDELFVLNDVGHLVYKEGDFNQQVAAPAGSSSGPAGPAVPAGPGAGLVTEPISPARPRVEEEAPAGDVLGSLVLEYIDYSAEGEDIVAQIGLLDGNVRDHPVVVS